MWYDLRYSADSATLHDYTLQEPGNEAMSAVGVALVQRRRFRARRRQNLTFVVWCALAHYRVTPINTVKLGGFIAISVYHTDRILKEQREAFSLIDVPERREGTGKQKRERRSLSSIVLSSACTGQRAKNSVERDLNTQLSESKNIAAHAPPVGCIPGLPLTRPRFCDRHPG